jgi:DNA-binding CsgD family transcriptional regulator
VDIAVTQIYSAASGRLPWEAALETIRAQVDGWAVQLFALDKRNGSMLFSHMVGSARPEDHLDYVRTYHRIDPRTPLLLQYQAGNWMHCHEHFDAQHVAADPFYQDFLIPAGGRWASGIKLVDDDEIAVLLGVHRGFNSQPLEAAALDWLNRLRPHLIEAIAIYRHLSAVHQALHAGQLILDAMHQPVLLVDAARRLRYANAAGRAVLDARTALQEFEGRLLCMDAGDDAQLLKALDDLAVAAPRLDAPQRLLVRLRGTHATQDIAVSLSGLRPELTMGAFGEVPLAMLLLHDAHQSAPIDAFVVQEFFGLTSAEATVAVLLAQGVGVEAIAQQRSVSVNTVRSQIQTLLKKTSSERQSYLVRRVLDLGRMA